MSNRRWRVATGLAIALVLLLASGTVTSAGGDLSRVKYVVVLDDAVHPDAVGPLSREIVASARGAIPSLMIERRADTLAAGRPGAPRDRDVVYRFALKGFAVSIDASEDSRLLDRLRLHPQVTFVAKDRPVELHAQMFQPGMERLRVRRNASTAVNDIDDVAIDADIAILDTGIDATHPDLNVHRSVSFVPGDTTDVDPHGHGTHVAGIAAAIDDANGVFGVAPGARLWAVKVIRSSGFGDESDVLSGLDYVMAHADEIDVVNMSFGRAALEDDGDCGATVGDALHQAICRVVDAGVVVVVSAGNYSPFGQDASLVSPASYDEVITVSAVVETDGVGPGKGRGPGTIYGVDNSFAGTFSNYGWDVDIAAPGVEVVSTWPGGGYATQTGTSVAAPHVAGAAALWIFRHGKPAHRADVLHVRDELRRLGFPQFGPDEGFERDKETYAEPLLNVAAIDPGSFDPVEPQLTPDKVVYTCGRDREANIIASLRNERGLPLSGLTSNAFLTYLSGVQREVRFEERGGGAYALTLGIEDLLPGDYDLTARVRDLSGFERSAGCRIVVRDPEPRLRLHELAFYWPVMNASFYSLSNPLHALLMNENGAPVVISPAQFETVFSGGGPELVWSYPPPDYVTGVFPGITYGAYRTEVNAIDTLPVGTYRADVTVSAGELSDSGSASFDIAFPDPALSAHLTSNLTVFDFTQPIEPPALDLTVDVRSEWSTGVAGLSFLVDRPFVVRADGEIVAVSEIVENYLDAGIYTLRGVAIDRLPHGPHRIVVHVTDSRGLEVDSNPIAIELVQQAGACANPLVDDGEADTDGDGLRDECDNCPTVSNRSQRDGRSDDPGDEGRGDACKSEASVKVSSDAGDNPDFLTIQDAVDRAIASPSGVRIDILTGSGPYLESVSVDRDQPFAFVGLDSGSGRPVIRSAGAGEPVFHIRSGGIGEVVVHNLVLRGDGAASGQSGILVDGGPSTDISNVRFERLETGADLRGGTHLLTQIVMDASVGTGFLVDDAAASVRYAELRGVRRGARIAGASASAAIEHLLLVGDGGGDGIVNDSPRPASLALRHSTLVNCGTAVRGAGDNTTIAHSIVWGNLSDLSGVPCSSVSWSNVQTEGCGTTNRFGDPMFVASADGDYHLQESSPLLEHGPDPALYTGMPCADLDGRPRLRDHDGDRLARVDPGAYERAEASTPPEVTGVVFSAQSTLRWDAEPSAAEYHVYRGLLSALSYSTPGVCQDAQDAIRSDTTFTDTAIPPTEDGFYYVVTSENALGAEATLGVGTCAERSNFATCP